VEFAFVYRNLSTVGLPLSGRPSELIELALSFGFDGMDIDILDFCQQAEIYGVEHARRLMVSARLKASSIHLPVSLAADDATFAAELERLPKLFEMAEATECTRALTTVAPASDDHAFKDFFELHRTRLDSIGNLAAQHGVKVGLALVPEAEHRAGLANQFIHTYEGLIGLIATAHDAVGAIVDSWALHLTGESPAVISQLPAGRLVELRLSDAPAEVAASDLIASQRLMPGETGVVDNVSLVKAAAAADFDGPVTPWAARATLRGIGRERIVRRAGERLESFWKDADLPIVPRWFAPAGQDSEGGDDLNFAGGDDEQNKSGEQAEAGSPQPASAS